MSEDTDLREKIDPRVDSCHWSDVLVQALPYFRHWVGKTVVVKYGGNAMLNEDLKAAVMKDIVLLSTIGIKVVLVHGGGPEINHMLERVGKESKFINGLRHTDAETMEIVQMVLTGKLNKDIVGLLLQEGGRAVGLSGVDSG
ncbi:MAG: acetylglutamate kinase, partial [Treponemataceae bacterium]|nr:acetylglutamate kinase [Treponemataceae bacterium]